MRSLLLLVVAVATALPAGSVALTLDPSEGAAVFDFEDGLQGWTLQGSAERVETGVLGGEWAVFGDGLAGGPPTPSGGGARMTLRFDPVEIAAVELDLFFLGNWEGMVPAAVVTVGGRALNEDGTTREIFADLPLLPPDPGALLSNPNRRALDLTPLNRPAWGQLDISWSLGLCLLGPGGLCRDLDTDDRLLALVDNVTIVPVPEPGTAALLAFGAASLTLARRGRR